VIERRLLLFEELLALKLLERAIFVFGLGLLARFVLLLLYALSNELLLLLKLVDSLLLFFDYVCDVLFRLRRCPRRLLLLATTKEEHLYESYL